jgi:hypothetical protein
MADDLRRYLAGRAPRARLEGALFRSVRRIRRRHWKWASFAAASAAAVLLLMLARADEEANVAKILILQKLQSSENTLGDWRREGREVSDFIPAVLSAVEDSRRKLEARCYRDAALRADQALLVTSLEHLIRKTDQMADHLARQGRDVSSTRRISQDARNVVRQGKSDRYPGAVRGVEQGMQSLCSLFQEHLTSKVEKIQAGVERWKRAGREALSVVHLMQEFEPLARAGRVLEADGVLDQALHTLVDSP